MDLPALRKAYQNCPRCSILCQNRTHVVFGEGNPAADILLIGEAPGASEDKQGIPFCGMSGKILDQLLDHIGLSRKDIFISNTILCRPPNNRNPTTEEVDNCSERLDQLIEIIQPKVIVTIGNFATKRIVGKTAINSVRGKTFSYEDRHQRKMVVVPVIHPASYLYSGRNPEMLQQMKQDFETIAYVAKQQNTQTKLTGY